MAKRNSQKRKTQQRKDRQAEVRYIASLRRQVSQYEGHRNPAHMPKERMEAIIKHGKRRHQIGSTNGIVLAMAAMQAMEESHGRR